MTILISTLGNVTLSDTTLTFTAEDFAVPQSIAVTPPEDIDLEAEIDTLSFRSDGIEFRRVPVLLADNDVQAILVGGGSHPSRRAGTPRSPSN